MNAINNTNLPNSLVKTDFPKPISAKTKEKTQELSTTPAERIDLAQVGNSPTFIRQYKGKPIRVEDAMLKNSILLTEEDPIFENYSIPNDGRSGSLVDSLQSENSKDVNTQNSKGLTGSTELDHLLLSAQEVAVGSGSIEKVFNTLVEYFEEIKNGKTSANDINDFSENISTINKLIEKFGIESTIGFLMEWNFPSWWIENTNKLPNYEPPDYEVLINFAKNNLDN